MTVLRFANGRRGVRGADGNWFRFPPIDSELPPPPVVTNTALPQLTAADNYIGTVPTYVPGTWTGSPTVVADLLRDGVVLAAGIAAGALPAFAVGDRLKNLAVRETPNNAPTAAVQSVSRLVTDAPPTLSAISNRSYAQNSGTQTIDVDTDHGGGGAGRTYSATGPGAIIDPATGILNMSTAAPQAGATITVSVTNSSGVVASRSFTLTVTAAAPISSGVTLPNQSYTQASAPNPRVFDASVGFTGSGMTFSLVSPPAGVSIAGATGLVSTSTTSLLSSSAVTVRATNAGGSLDRAFNVAVVAAAGVPPTLSGTAIPNQLNLLRGSAATVIAAATVAAAFAGTVTTYSLPTAVPGVSINSGTGAVTLAKTATQVPTAVVVRAANADGSAEASFQLSVTIEPIGLADVTLTIRPDVTGETASGVPAGFGTWHIDLVEANYAGAIDAVWWRGDAHVAGDGPGNGYQPMIRHPSVANRWIARAVTPVTGAPRIRPFLYANDPAVGSTANRIGEELTHHFIYTTDTSGNLIPGPTNIVATISQATPGVVSATAHGFQNGQIVRLTTTGALPSPLVAGTDYFVVVSAANTFQLSLTLGGGSIATTTAGSGTHTVSARNREFCAASAALVQTLQMFIEPSDPGATAQARVVPFAMKEEYDEAIATGYVPGCGMQQVTAASQCRAVPSVIWMAGDSHAVWRVADFGLAGGPTFRRPLLKGLPTLHTEGILADPVDPLRAIVYAGGFFTPDYDGLYLTTDGGDNWTRVYDGGGLNSNTGEYSAIAYDPSTSGSTQRLIAILPSSANAGFAFIKSLNRGASWSSAGTWAAANGRPEQAVGIPGTAGAFFVSASDAYGSSAGSGFYKVTNAFGTPVVTRINVTGTNTDLPSGPIYVSSDGQTVQIAMRGKGVWRSVDGGATWERRGTLVKLLKGFTNPWNVDQIVTGYDDGTTSAQNTSRPSWTTDGETWTQTPVANVTNRPGSTEKPWMCSGRDHAFYHPSYPGKILYIGRQSGLHVGNNNYTSDDYGAHFAVANKGYNGTNCKVFTPSVCIFSSKDKNKCHNPIYDAGGQITFNGFKYYERTQSGYTNVTNKANAVVAAGAARGLSTIGCAVHPDKSILLEVTGDYTNACCMIRSANDGVSWAAVPTLVGQKRKSGGIFYNFSDPGKVMWANYRSVDGNWATWSAMSAIGGSSFAVCGMTTKQTGTNYFFACDVLSGTGRIFKRSDDNGATWTTVLTLTYDCRASGSAAFYAHPSDPNIIYVRDSTRHRIRKYNLSAGTFTILNIFGAENAGIPAVTATAPANGQLPHDIGFIAVDARFPDVMYCTIGNNGYGRDNLWRSVDGGATWTSLCPIVGYFAKSSLYVHPLTGDVLIGGDKGSHILPPPYAQAGRLFDGLPYESYVGLAA